MNERKNMFYISDEYDDNLTTLKELRAKGTPISEYVNKALRFYTKYLSSPPPTPVIEKEEQSPFPRLDQYLDKKINGKDANTEIHRLLENNIITSEQAAKAYLGAKQFVIQMENTQVIRESLQLDEDKYTIRSKRDSLSTIVIDKVKGNLVDIFAKISKEQDQQRIKEEAKQKEKLERDKWIKENSNVPWPMRGRSQQEIETYLMIQNEELIIVEDEEINEEEELVNNILPS